MSFEPHNLRLRLVEQIVWNERFDFTVDYNCKLELELDVSRAILYELSYQQAFTSFSKIKRINQHFPVFSLSHNNNNNTIGLFSSRSIQFHFRYHGH